MSVFTQRHWNRHFGANPLLAHSLSGGGPQPVLSQGNDLTGNDFTLLRSRFYPSFTYHETAVNANTERAMAMTYVQFVAWADQIPGSPTPDLDSVDDRIIATGQLTPRYQPSSASPTTRGSMVWTADGGLVESFAQRRTDPGDPNPFLVYAAIYPIDWSLWLYTSRASQEFTYWCAIEILLGYRP